MENVIKSLFASLFGKIDFEPLPLQLDLERRSGGHVSASGLRRGLLSPVGVGGARDSRFLKFIATATTTSSVLLLNQLPTKRVGTAVRAR